MKHTRSETMNKKKRHAQPVPRTKTGKDNSGNNSPRKNVPVEEEEEHDDRMIDPNKP